MDQMPGNTILLTWPIMHLRKLCVYSNISAGGDKKDLITRLSDLRSQLLDNLCLPDSDDLSHLSSQFFKHYIKDNGDSNLSTHGRKTNPTARLSYLPGQLIDKLCLPSLDDILHLSSRFSKLRLQNKQGHDSAPKMLITSPKNSESACIPAQYTLKDESLSFHFFHATMTRYDYIRLLSTFRISPSCHGGFQQ
jgi:hypothetical protein